MNCFLFLLSAAVVVSALTVAAHCCHMGTAAIKHPVPYQVRRSFVIDGLTRSGTGCFIAAVAIWHQWASNGYSSLFCCQLDSASMD